MYPKDDPKVIVYVAFQRSYNTSVLPETVKTIVKDTAKYLKIFEEAPEINKEVLTYKLKNYKNKSIEEVKQDLDSLGANYKIFGSGFKIVNQYPKKGTKLNTKNNVLLFTNDASKKMPNVIGYSFKEASIILSNMGINYKIESSGYVNSQSVGEGIEIKDDTIVVLN